MRKRCNRRPITALPPRGLRPKLPVDQLRDLDLVHLVNLDTIHRGEADEDTLWAVVGGVLTWSMVASRLQRGEVEMDAQVALTRRLVDHYRACGRVEFTADDYELAKTGTVVMGLLAADVDRPTAIMAAAWSEQRVDLMSAACSRRFA